MNVIVPKTENKYETQYNVAKKAENICQKLMSKTEFETLMSNFDANNRNCDAVCLYVLYKTFGFTAEQLRSYFNEVTAILTAEKEADEFQATYGKIPQLTALKDEIGVDLEAWYKEVEASG